MSPLLTDDEIRYFMNEALLEGRKALPNCLPNPPVGCVIVNDKEIIARGYTNEPGQFHAEAMALKKIENLDGKNLSVFVTLEPCSFHGRTPSCAKKIIEKGIKNVFVGILDPHPKNQGAGIRLLQQANISVEVGVLEDVIYSDLKDYLIHQ